MLFLALLMIFHTLKCGIWFENDYPFEYRYAKN